MNKSIEIQKMGHRGKYLPRKRSYRKNKLLNSQCSSTPFYLNIRHCKLTQTTRKTGKSKAKCWEFLLDFGHFINSLVSDVNL
jgi:hypothetical protein